MAQKSNHTMKKNTRPNKKDSYRSSALFCGAFLAEMYLMLIAKYYVNGSLLQAVTWDGYLHVMVFVGLAVLAAGAVLAVLKRKEPGWMRTTGICMAAGGAFVAVASWLVRTFFVPVLAPMCVIVAAVAIVLILWDLYDRECTVSLLTLGVAVGVLWLCHKGVGNGRWNTVVLACSVVFLVALALEALLIRKVAASGGMLKNIRLLTKNSDVKIIYGSCAVAAVTVIASMFSATVAYYAMWGVCMCIFVLAIYYTVRQL